MCNKWSLPSENKTTMFLFSAAKLNVFVNFGRGIFRIDSFEGPSACQILSTKIQQSKLFA